MKRNAPRQRNLLTTREKLDLRQHGMGVLAALAYASLIIVISAISSFVVYLIFASVAHAAENPTSLTSSTQLIDQAKELDGQVVTFEGEAIGEALERGKHAFVNTNDGKNAIGIWMPRSDSSRISAFGDYDHIGDKIRVTGKFNRACKEHGGDLDIHAAKVEILLEGSGRPHPVAPGKIIATGIALVILAASGLLYRRRKSGKAETASDG